MARATSLTLKIRSPKVPGAVTGAVETPNAGASWLGSSTGASQPGSRALSLMNAIVDGPFEARGEAGMLLRVSPSNVVEQAIIWLTALAITLFVVLVAWAAVLTVRRRRIGIG